jgi:hypothetical protein
MLTGKMQVSCKRPFAFDEITSSSDLNDLDGEFRLALAAVA